MKILVSNPSFQYSLQTVKALQRANYEVYFATTYWFNPNGLVEQVAKLLSKSIYLKLSKKTDPIISSTCVLTIKNAFFYSILCKLMYADVEKRSFLEDRFHDKWVSRWVKNNKLIALIGYEKSSLMTFKMAKNRGVYCFLDLAQVHPNYISFLRTEYDFFREITGSKGLFEKISSLKEKEYQFTDIIFCLSSFAQDTMVKGGIADEKMVVNSLGFEPTVFSSKSFSQLNTQSKIRFVYAGIITKRKGVELLLEAFKDIDETKAELVLIGPRGDAYDLVQSYNTSNVRYKELVEQNELASMFRSSDVFVFPSYLDSWAAVIPEAMACGLPIITTHSTGAAEIVSAEVGILINGGNLVELKKAIEFFINNPQSIISMGKAAVEISKNHTWSEYQHRLVSQIQKIK